MLAWGSPSFMPSASQRLRVARDQSIGMLQLRPLPSRTTGPLAERAAAKHVARYPSGRVKRRLA